MDRILTEGRTVIRSDTQRELEETIRPYNMGITLLDVNFRAARPPEEVKPRLTMPLQHVKTSSSTSVKQKRTPTKFSHVLTVRRSVFWKKRVLTKREPSRKHRVKWLVSQKILPEYKAAPQITRERLYIETMEKC